MDSRERENAEQYARERLREKAQNEATCIALSGLFNQAQIEIASLTAEVERLRAELAAREWRMIDENTPWDTPILVGPTKRMGICVAMHDSRDGWVTETCSEWAAMYAPSHWMPLPPEPKP